MGRWFGELVICLVGGMYVECMWSVYMWGIVCVCVCVLYASPSLLFVVGVVYCFCGFSVVFRWVCRCVMDGYV